MKLYKFSCSHVIAQLAIFVRNIVQLYPNLIHLITFSLSDSLAPMQTYLAIYTFT